MAGSVDYQRLARAVQARGLFGRWRRRRAVDLLAELGTAQAVAPLITALGDSDREIAARARAALVGLTEQGAKDALCAAWVKSRDAALGAILAEGKHVAAQPIAVRVLSALKTGQLDALGEPDPPLLEALAQALDDADVEIADGADQWLKAVTDQEVINRACEAVIAHPDGSLRTAALRFAWRHNDTARDCLFLFFTDQWDEYFSQDIDCQYVAEEYRQAPPELQQRIREKIRTVADQRLSRILRVGGDRGDSATGTSDLDVAIDVAARNENYQRLFELLPRARYVHIMRIMERLTKVGWKPADETDRAFLDELTPRYRELAILAQQPDSQFGQGGLETLLADPSLAERSTDELRRLAASGSPRARACALVALASRRVEDLTPLVEQASNADDWTLRLAALLASAAAGMALSPTFVEKCLADPVQPIRAAAIQAFLVAGFAGRTPADIQRLQDLADQLSAEQAAAAEVPDEVHRIIDLLLCVLRYRFRTMQLVKGEQIAAPDRAAVRVLRTHPGGEPSA